MLECIDRCTECVFYRVLFQPIRVLVETEGMLWGCVTAYTICGTSPIALRRHRFKAARAGAGMLPFVTYSHTELLAAFSSSKASAYVVPRNSLRGQMEGFSITGTY